MNNTQGVKKYAGSSMPLDRDDMKSRLENVVNHKEKLDKRLSNLQTNTQNKQINSERSKYKLEQHVTSKGTASKFRIISDEDTNKTSVIDSRVQDREDNLSKKLQTYVHSSGQTALNMFCKPDHAKSPVKTGNVSEFSELPTAPNSIVKNSSAIGTPQVENEHHSPIPSETHYNVESGESSVHEH